jgi:TetR/AcrR family transcriptional regulator, transcriptional repressor for nem operon
LEKAEANSGSFYYYFKSKEELLLAVLDQYVELLYPEVMDRAFAATADPIERVFAVLGGYRYALEITGCTFGCPLGRVALEISDIPAAHEKVAINFQGWITAIEKCLDDAGNRLPSNLDRHQLAQFVLAVMEGAVMQARVHRSLEPFDNSVAQLREYFRMLMSAPRVVRMKQ